MSFTSEWINSIRLPRSLCCDMETRDCITVDHVRQALKTVYRADPEINLQVALSRALADDLKPVDERGRLRPNILWILVAAMWCAFIGIFVFFSIGAHP
jgi:hypothetical protein